MLLGSICVSSPLLAQPSRADTDLRRKYNAALQEIDRLRAELAKAKQDIARLRQQSARSAAENRPQPAVTAEQYQKAIAERTRRIEADPQDTQAYVERGIAYTRLGEYQRALNDLNRAIALDASNATAYNPRGIVYYQLEQYSKALKDFNRAITHDPYQPESYNNRGVLYQTLGDYKRAMTDLRQAARLGLDTAPEALRILRADVQQAQKRLQQAGFSPGPADGAPGSKTLTALRAYQRHKGLPVTGQFDTKTKQALGLQPSAGTSPHAASSTILTRFVKKPTPQYPMQARQQGWEGTVTLRFEMLANGTIGAVEIAKSSGYPLLDTTAQNTLKQWTHRPAQENGRPVTQWATLDFTFTLDKSSNASP